MTLSKVPVPWQADIDLKGHLNRVQAAGLAMTALWFILGLAGIIGTSCCHKYVTGRHSLTAALFLPSFPQSWWMAFRKWSHYNRPETHSSTVCWVCKQIQKRAERGEQYLTR